MNGNKWMTMNSEQLKQQVANKHGVQFMSDGNFGSAQRAVELHLNTAGVQKDFQEFPVILRLLIKQNKQTTSAALQTENGNDTFLRFLRDSQLRWNWRN